MNPVSDLTGRLPVSADPPDLSPAAARSLLRVLLEAERKSVLEGDTAPSRPEPDALAS